MGDTRDPLKEGINSTAKNTAILPEMNRNMVEHDFLTQLVSSNIKQLRMAISGRI